MDETTMFISHMCCVPGFLCEKDHILLYHLHTKFNLLEDFLTKFEKSTSWLNGYDQPYTTTNLVQHLKYY
jgi:hypothetical protein